MSFIAVKFVLRLICGHRVPTRWWFLLTWIRFPSDAVAGLGLKSITHHTLSKFTVCCRAESDQHATDNDASGSQNFGRGNSRTQGHHQRALPIQRAQRIMVPLEADMLTDRRQMVVSSSGKAASLRR